MQGGLVGVLKLLVWRGVGADGEGCWEEEKPARSAYLMHVQNTLYAMPTASGNPAGSGRPVASGRPATSGSLARKQAVSERDQSGR